MSGETVVCMLRVKKERNDRQQQVAAKRRNFLRRSYTSQSGMLLSEGGLEIELKFALGKFGRYTKFW
jgi:hypothetical protein